MIRYATEADGAEIAEIYNYYVAHTTASFDFDAVDAADMVAKMKSCRPAFLVEVGNDGRVEGYCYAHLWKSRPAYAHTLETSVYVRPDCRHKWIGMRLMGRLIAECRQDGVGVLIACITDDNEASVALHGKLGFEQVSHFKGVGRKFGRILGVVDMELVL